MNTKEVAKTAANVGPLEPSKVLCYPNGSPVMWKMNYDNKIKNQPVVLTRKILQQYLHIQLNVGGYYNSQEDESDASQQLFNSIFFRPTETSEEADATYEQPAMTMGRSVDWLLNEALYMTERPAGGCKHPHPLMPAVRSDPFEASLHVFEYFHTETL